MYMYLIYGIKLSLAYKNTFLDILNLNMVSKQKTKINQKSS